MVTIIPSKDKTLSQPNIGDTQGTFWSTFNIDVSENEGKIRLGKRLIVNTDSTDVAQISGVPVGFRSFGSSGKIYTAAGASGTGYVFKTASNDTDSNFVKDALANSPATCDSAYSDIEVLNGQLFVTTGSQTVYYLDNNEATWNHFDMVVSDTSQPHLLCNYGNRMYCTYGGNSIISWDNSTSPVVASAGAQYTLSLQADTSESQITFIRAASNRIWIGTVSKHGGKGAIYSWDGSANQTTSLYRIRASGALSCVVLNDVPYVMDTSGRLLVWNGGTFIEAARLNVQNKRYLYNPYGVTNLRFIHPNGMSVINGRVCALIDGRSYDGALGNPDTFSQPQTVPSGVYEFDTLQLINSIPYPNKGLIHKHSISLGHSGSTITDYGQIRVKAVGALSEMMFNKGSTSTNGTFLAGASYSNDISSSSGVNYGMWYDDIQDTKQKSGHFITPKLYSAAVTEQWQKVFVQYRNFLDSGDKMVVKYRTVDIPFTEVVVTPTATNQFTYAGDLTAAVAVGDEISFVQGVNSGICAHVTAISYNGSTTTTVTIDETITSNSPHTSKIRYQKWTKCKEVTYGSVTTPEALLGKTSSWIQFKVWMLFTGQDEIESVSVASIVNQPIK